MLSCFFFLLNRKKVNNTFENCSERDENNCNPRFTLVSSSWYHIILMHILALASCDCSDLHCGLHLSSSSSSSRCICAFLFIMFATRSPLSKLSVMNQFQALFESFLTIDGVPALTFCNEVRSPYLPVGVPPQQEERANEWADWNTGLHCLGKFNLP